MSLVTSIENKLYRRPLARVFLGSPERNIAPRRVQIPDRSGVISLSQSFGQPIAGGSVVIKDPPFDIRIKDTIEIHLGYDNQVVPVFLGFVTNPAEQAYPNEWQVTVQDILWLADFSTTGDTGINLGNDKTANEVLTILLRDWAGIPESRIAIPTLEQSPGTPWMLGKLTPIAFQGSPLAACQEICGALGYWLFADAGGVVRALKISGTPTTAGYRHLRDGKDYLLTSPPRTDGDVSTLYTRVVVTGAATGVELTSVTDTWQVEHPLLPDGKFRELAYQNKLLEYLNEEDAGAASVTAVTRRLLAEHSRSPHAMSVQIKGDPRASVGRTITVSNNRLRISSRNYFVYRHAVSFGGATYTSSLVLDGGVGSGGYTTVPPPLAAYTSKLFAETMNGTDVIEVVLDGGASKSMTEGEIVSYAWQSQTPTYDGSPMTATGRYAVFVYPATATEAIIALTVTDTSSKTDTVTQTIPLTAGATPIGRRVLNFAAGNAWYATPDGGKTWNVELGQDAIAVPPISNAGNAEADQEIAKQVGLLATGGAGGVRLRATTDALATPSANRATLPGPITMLWHHERDGKRIWAAVGTTPYLSTDGGETFAAKTAAPNAKPVTWIVESFAQNGSTHVLAGDIVYETFDSGATYAEVYNAPPDTICKMMVSGFERHWVGMGNLDPDESPLRSIEGDTAAFSTEIEPRVTEIMALTMLVDEPTLIAVDQVGRIWKVSAEDGGNPTQIAVMPSVDGTPDVAHHMIRLPDENVCLIAANKALYKLFPSSGYIGVMLPVGVGQQGHMVGYAELGIPQRQSASKEMIVPTWGTTGGIWHGVPTSPTTTAWTEKGVGALPPGMKWAKVVSSPGNPDHWLALGGFAFIDGSQSSSRAIWTKVSNFVEPLQAVEANGTTPSGFSPAWLTRDAGATWTALQLPFVDGALQDAAGVTQLRGGCFDSTGRWYVLMGRDGADAGAAILYGTGATPAGHVTEGVAQIPNSSPTRYTGIPGPQGIEAASNTPPRVMISWGDQPGPNSGGGASVYIPPEIEDRVSDWVKSGGIAGQMFDTDPNQSGDAVTAWGTRDVDPGWLSGHASAGGSTGGFKMIPTYNAERGGRQVAWSHYGIFSGGNVQSTNGPVILAIDGFFTVQGAQDYLLNYREYTVPMPESLGPNGVVNKLRADRQTRTVVAGRIVGTVAAYTPHITYSDDGVNFKFMEGPPVAATALANWAEPIVREAVEIEKKSVITSPLIWNVIAGSPVSYAITATNNPTSYAVTGTLPSGFTVSADGRIISGTTTAVGTYEIGVAAFNAAGGDTRTVVIKVTAQSGSTGGTGGSTGGTGGGSTGGTGSTGGGGTVEPDPTGTITAASTFSPNVAAPESGEYGRAMAGLIRWNFNTPAISGIPMLHAYNRSDYGWYDFQNALGGAFNWSNLDTDIETCIRAGQRLTVSIRCVGNGYTLQRLVPTGIPGAMYDYNGRDLFIPDWNSSQFSSGVQTFVEALRDHLDTTNASTGKKRRLYVTGLENMLYGIGGEWYEPSDLTIKGGDTILHKLIEIVADAATSIGLFPIMMTDAGRILDAQGRSMLGYALQYHALYGQGRASLGSPDFNDKMIRNQNNEPAQLLKQLQPNRWKVAPFGTETYNPSKLRGWSWTQNMLTDTTRWHLSMIGNGNMVDNMTATELANVKLSGARAGHRLRISTIKLPAIKSGQALVWETVWDNGGTAPTYDAWTVTFRLRSGSPTGTVAWSGVSSVDLRNVISGAFNKNDTFTVTTPGTFWLTVGVTDPDGICAPMRLAQAGDWQSTTKEHALGTITVG